MYARLWWKEVRTFWPLWPVLALIAVGLQWILRESSKEMATGWFVIVGLVLSALYAFAVGAGTFAVESESNTQTFLDTLPVDRRMLWTSKLTFALASTLGLTLVLVAIGWYGTENYDANTLPVGSLVSGFGTVLVEGIAWSVLLSLLVGSALHAALLGMLVVALLQIIPSGTVVWWYGVPPAWMHVAAAGPGRGRDRSFVGPLHVETATGASLVPLLTKPRGVGRPGPRGSPTPGGSSSREAPGFGLPGSSGSAYGSRTGPGSCYC